MSRYIDADILTEVLKSNGLKDFLVYKFIDEEPTVDVEPVIYAHWEKVYGYVTPGGDPVWVCSNCGKGMHVWGVEASTYNRDISDNRQWVACPNCGAKMDVASSR